MTLADDIEQACRTHDIRDVLGTQKKLIVCPLPMHLHHSNTPSFSIFWQKGLQYWKCHGSCAREGDVVDLVGYLRIPGYDDKNTDHIRRALELIGQRYEPKIVLPEEQEVLRGDEWRDFLPPGIEAIEYAASRGLNTDTMRKFRIGQSKNSMTIPCFEDHKLTGIKLRNLRPCDKRYRYFSLEGSHQGLFNFDAVYLTQEPVLIVKAEIPVMLLDQYGILACAPTGGEGGWREPWRTALALSPNRIVVGDNDEPGRKLGERRAAFLAADLKFPPEIYKDVDDWVLAEPQNALKTIREWMEAA
jgi:hypothetical protein